MVRVAAGIEIDEKKPGYTETVISPEDMAEIWDG